MIEHKSGKTAGASQQGLRTELSSQGRSQPQIAKILQLDMGTINRGLRCEKQEVSIIKLITKLLSNQTRPLHQLQLLLQFIVCIYIGLAE